MAVDVAVAVEDLPAWMLDEFAFFLGEGRTANDSDLEALAALAAYPEHVVLQSFDAAQVWLQNPGKGPIHSLGRWLLGTAERKQAAERQRGSSVSSWQAEMPFVEVDAPPPQVQPLPALPRASPANGDGGEERQLWEGVLHGLSLQLPPDTFDNWVRPMRLLASEDDEYVIGLDNARARDWVENRFANTLRRTLSSHVGRPVQVRFVVVAMPDNEDG